MFTQVCSEAELADPELVDQLVEALDRALVEQAGQLQWIAEAAGTDSLNCRADPRSVGISGTLASRLSSASDS